MLITILKKRNLFFVVLLYVLCISACKKFINVSPPDTQVTANNVFTDDKTATSAVVGLYSQIMANNLYFLNGGTTLYPSLSADELYRTSPNVAIDAFTNNAIPAESSVIQNDFWAKAYNYIYQANACLEGLNQSTGVSADTKQQLTGEIKFMRALSFFYLSNLFGDVPLTLSTDYIINEQMPRTASSQIYEQIISDLKDAKALLGEDDASSKSARPGKFSAEAMLARVYLYQKNWAGAEDNATSVINSGKYKIVTDAGKVFVSNSKEIIFQLMPVISGLNTAEGATFIPSSASIIPAYAISPYLLNDFEPGDIRKSEWLHSSFINGQTYYYPFKYRIRSSTQISEYNIILRLAEQYLIRAEARAEQNNIAGAVSDLNVIRQRAGLPALSSGLTKTDCIAAIMHERRTELFCEWGHRWMDLKRLGQIDKILAGEKLEWQPNDALYPIPFSEIEANNFLVQNPGY